MISERMIKSWFLTPAILLLLFILTMGQQAKSQPGNRQQLRLRNSPPSGKYELNGIDPSDPALSGARAMQKIWAILQLEKIPGPGQRQSLARNGIILYEYIPDNAWLASFSKRISLTRLQQLGVQEILPISRGLRYGIQQTTTTRSALRSMPVQAYHVQLIPGVDSNELKSLIRQTLAGRNLGYKINRFLAPHLVEIQVKGEALDLLMDQPYILQVMDAPEMKTFNNGATDSHLSDLVQNGSAELPALKGSGVAIGLGDNGRIYHIDHRYNEEGQTYSGSYHATMVAGIMAGAGIQDPAMKGNAPAAKLLVENFTDILVKSPDYLSRYGMQVTNNSYGAGSSCNPVSGYYSGNCWYIDNQVIKYPELVHVFAAGNSGNLRCGEFPQGYKTIDNAFQAAKNVITVGTTNTDATVFRWSKGPTVDGRIKPEISAIGDGVNSTSTLNRYSTDYGSSMAAPQVSGALALLVERYRQLNNNNNPPGDLLKAIVCNTATDIGIPGVDYTNGFGWLNARAAVAAIQNKTYQQGTVEQDNEWTYTIRLTEAKSDFRIMLYWHDRPASVFSYLSLVNDLDLTVQVPDGSILEPFVLDTSATGLTAPAKPGKDHLNNIEQVVIKNANPGTYTIRVKGYRIPFGPQSFQMVYHHSEANLRLLQPAGGELWKPGQKRNIIWEGVGAPTVNNLEFHYTTDNGVSWFPVTGSSTLPGRITWTVPNLVSTQTRLRITNKLTGEVQTSPGFSILPDYQLTVVPECREDVLLKWRPAQGVDSVEIFRFSGNDYQSLGITTDTFFSVKSLRYGPDYWFTVAPVKNGVTGEKSIAKTTKTRNIACGPNGPDGDISLETITRPLTQRQWTRSDAGGRDTVMLSIRNRGTTELGGPFFLAVRDDQGNVLTDTLIRKIAAGTSFTWKTRIFLQLNPGEERYLKYTVQSAGDPELNNNESASWWRYLRNDPINMPFTQHFNNLKDTIYRKPGFTGLYGADNWDMSTAFSSVTLQTVANDSTPFRIISRVGDQSVSLIGTYNLEGIDTLTPLRLVIADDGIQRYNMSIRGADSLPWILYFPHPVYGLSHFLRLGKQSPGSSFQVRVDMVSKAQTDTVQQFLKNLKFFVPEKDLGVIDLNFIGKNTPVVTNGDTVRLSATVYNYRKEDFGPYVFGVRFNDGSRTEQNMPGLKGFDTARISFTHVIKEPENPDYTITPYVRAEGDEYPDNDSFPGVLSYLQIINTYPYLNGFENGRKWWESSGSYDLPGSGTLISGSFHAANGKEFWGSKLVNGDDSTSPVQRYLYGEVTSPVFDLRTLKSPHLSMSILPEICNYDYEVYLQYSLDSGLNWAPYKPLPGTFSTNWYPANDSSFKSCTLENRWQVASVSLPGSWEQVMFRLSAVLKGYDRFVQPKKPEGFFIDDFHLFDLERPVSTASYNLTGTAKAGAWSNLPEAGPVSAAISPGSNSVPFRFAGNNLNTGREIAGNKILPRHWVFNSMALPDSGRLRLYLAESELAQWLQANPCDTCQVKQSAYDLSIFRYAGNPATINGDPADNEEGMLTVWEPGDFDLVPFANGYYAELPAGAYGEYYFGINQTIASIQFSAKAQRNPDLALLSWSSSGEGILRFEVERAEVTNGQTGAFQRIQTITAGAGTEWSYSDKEIRSPGNWQYRIRVYYTDGSSRYSTIRIVHLDASLAVRLYPVPATRRDQLLLIVQQAEGPLELQLSDAVGRVIWRNRATLLPGQQMVSLQGIPGLPAGIYHLRVASGKEIKTLPLVISGN